MRISNALQLTDMVTMSDIAARAGVSQTTVSFVLNGRSSHVKITEETRKRVLDTAREMGYRRNELARAMATGRTRVLGLLTYNGVAEHVSSVIDGALSEAVIRGYSVKVQHIPYFSNEEQILELIHTCSTWRLDGTIAVMLLENAIELLKVEMESNGWPIMYVETAPHAASALQVGTDDNSGIYAAVEHLLELGHRRIAFLSGPQTQELAVRRYRFFCDAMHSLAGANHEGLIQFCHWSNPEIVERSVQELLDSPLPPTAVICPGDGAAMIASRVVRRNGLSVPGDLSIVGFGNFNFGIYADPPLTTIAQPFHEVGRIAMNRLVDAIEAGEKITDLDTQSSTTPILLPTTLCVRQSTAPPRHIR